MSWLQDEIMVNERRVRRIAQNPAPGKMKSNKMLYELELGLRKAQLEASEKCHVFLASGMLLEPVFSSLGLQSLDLQAIADRVMAADKYLDVVRAEGFPDSHCDRTLVPIGMCISGALPLPRLIVTSNAFCDPMFLGLNALAHRFDIPVFCLDIALEENLDTIGYVANQLKELIAFVETHVPGARFDEDKLEKLHGMNRQALEYMRQIYQLRKQVPCPIPTEDTFRLPRIPACYPDPDYCLEYWRAYVEEIKERAGKQQMPEEKLRVMWTCGAPYFADPFHVLAERGANVVIFQMDVVAKWMAGKPGIYGDLNYGRKLQPLEEEARMLYSSGWVGHGTKWIEDVISVCRDLKIDAVVNFLQVGCMATSGLATILADKLEKELGIPVLNLEGRQLTSESYNKAQFEGALEQFVDMCLLAKGNS